MVSNRSGHNNYSNVFQMNEARRFDKLVAHAHQNNPWGGLPQKDMGKTKSDYMRESYEAQNATRRTGARRPNKINQLFNARLYQVSKKVDDDIARVKELDKLETDPIRLHNARQDLNRYFYDDLKEKRKVQVQMLK